MTSPRIRIPVPYAILFVVFVAVSAWTWSWADHPLIPDEAFAKEMVDSFAANRTPFAQEDFTDYRNGAFGVDRYGGAYANHSIARPATSVAVPIEQGLAGVKLGRAVTLAVGVVAIAYLGSRLGGPWGGLFAGALYLTHPATLYFHQSYFSNSGGVAYFLASLATLEASRKRWWLAPVSAFLLGVAVIFRVEYALAGLFLVPLAGTLGPLRGWKAWLAYYLPVGIMMAVLWNLESLAPDLNAARLLTENLDLKDAILHPIDTMRSTLERYQGEDVPFALDVVQQNLWDSFAFMFPFTSLLALLGLFVRLENRAASWVYLPLALQSGLQAYAILPALDGFDFTGSQWLESSIVRYFLVTYALCALLAGVALSALAKRIPARDIRISGVTWQRVGALTLTLLLTSTAVVHAKQAEHGVDWANERRPWFDEIDAAAAEFGENAIFVGKTPGKVIFSRPLMNPENVGWNAKYTVEVLTDLIDKGHRVFALEPWYYIDHGRSIESLALNGGKTYWTDTGVEVACGCGSVARFFELHPSNVTFTNIARLVPGTFSENATGLTTGENLTLFYPERALHVRMGQGSTDSLVVSLRYLDEGTGNVTAGYWNLPLDTARNEHPRLEFERTDSGKWKTVKFTIEKGDVINGPLYIRGTVHFDQLGVRSG